MNDVSPRVCTRSFNELNKDDVGIAGGKGASLGEMTQAGIPVPPGFVVLTTAFEQFLDETDLRQVIRAELAKVDQAAVHTAELASEHIQNLIKQEEVPDDIAAVVLEAFNTLDTKFVAVRSSATSEDGTENAWAGQLDSFLNTTEETLLENVKNCWASLFTPRAIFYRIEKGLKESHVSVAVVVQKMVESESSGIAFSVHPVTEDPNQLIIEAGFGLGEAIVSGSITPDSYVVEKEPRVIIDSNVVEQRRGIFRKGDNGENEWRDIPSEQGAKQVLSEEQIRELSEEILRIEQHYGFPCDIEWALEGGAFYIVQSRPITTLQGVEWGQKVSRTEPAVLTDPSMYEQSFHAHGVSLLVADVHTHYGEFDYVAFSLANEFRIFVKKDLSLLAQLCSSYYDDASAVEESAARIDSAIHHLDTLKMVLDEKHKITVEEFDRFMEEAGKFLMEYSRFDTFVTDRLFDDGARPEIITEIHARKNTVREQGNQVFFNEGSVFSKLLDKIANQNDVTVDVLHHNRVDDVRALLTTNTALPKMVETDYLIIKANTDRQYYYGKDVLDIANHLLHTEVRDDGSLSGVSVAKRGVVQGVVKKVATDYKNFSTDHIGDKNTILVTEMTVPEMTSAMQQSAAIVTDLGGMLSHAAITARELNLPCVIGTQVATQVLQDGDMVEVDAYNGVVKLIEEGGKQVLDVSEGTTNRSDVHQNGGYSVRDYYFLYQTTGFPRLYVDLCVRYYGNFDTLATCRDGVFRIYVSRDDKADKTTEEIAKLYGSTKAFTEACEQLYQRLSEVPEKVATLTDSKPTTTSLANFLAFVGESFSLYALFDHVHTDNLFTDKAPDNATELANIVAEHKNKIRERFDEEFFIADSTMSEFFNWLAKTYDTTPETITAYTIQELLTLVETGRHPVGETENFVLAGKEQVVIDYTGKEAVDFISAFEASNVEKDTSKLSGTVAYGSGVVRGVVRVMDVDYRTLAHSLARINDQAGDFILIAESTLPEMLPAMKRSSAIITDVGGILSHAAISAREIEKTCLIGTQYATQVLQDGDMVEVDADNGLVKILEQGGVSKEIE